MILSPSQITLLREANSKGGTLSSHGAGFLKEGDIADLTAQGLIEPIKDQPGWFSITSAGNLELAATTL